MLTKNNYLAWSIKIKVSMRAQGVWHAVEPKDPKMPIEEKKDQMALAAIYQGMTKDMLFFVSEKEKTKETWGKHLMQGGSHQLVASVIGARSSL